MKKYVETPADEAVLLHQGGASRRDSAFPRRRLLRDVRRRRDQGQRHSGHHAHAACQRRRDLRRAGGLSLPCHRYLPAQTGARRRTCGDLRATRRPEARQGPRQARRDRAGDARHRIGRQHSGQQGEQLYRLDLFRSSDHRCGFPRHIHGRILRRRGDRRLYRQADLQPRTEGGDLPARLRGPLHRSLRFAALHLPARRVGLLGGGQPREALQAVRHAVAQGLRRRALYERHRRRRRHPLLPRIHRAPRDGPHPLHRAHRPERLRVGRQVHDPQPRTLRLERCPRERELRRDDRPHAHPDGRSSAQAVDRHADPRSETDRRAPRHGRALHARERARRSRPRAGGDDRRSGAHRLAHRGGTRHAARTGAAQELARRDRDPSPRRCSPRSTSGSTHWLRSSTCSYLYASGSPARSTPTR